MAYDKVVVPSVGEKITLQDGKLNVPDNPIVAFIEGDGTGVRKRQAKPIKIPAKLLRRTQLALKTPPRTQAVILVCLTILLAMKRAMAMVMKRVMTMVMKPVMVKS